MLALVLGLLMLLLCTFATAQDSTEEQPKARAYRPGTAEFDDLVKSIRNGDFTQKTSKTRKKPSNTDL